LKIIESLSFDDDNKSPSVLATRNDDGHCLLERLFFVDHVSAVNSPKNISMSSTKSPKPDSSNAVPKARPFDEFTIDVKPSNNTFDGQDFATTKSDKD
jgi:hypothetical protein